MKCPTSFYLVLITAPSLRLAKKLGRILVEARLAACVNILPGLRSLYRWQGKIHDDREVLLLCKTDAAHFAALRRAVRRTHPYQTPEIIALPLADGDPDYLSWLTASLAG